MPKKKPHTLTLHLECGDVVTFRAESYPAGRCWYTIRDQYAHAFSRWSDCNADQLRLAREWLAGFYDWVIEVKEMEG